MASAVGLQTHIWNNNFKSTLLLLGYPVLLLLMLFAFFALMAASSAPQGYAQTVSPLDAGLQGVYAHWPIAIGVATVWFLIAWAFHQNMINRATGARPVSRQEQPELYNLLENLCISRGFTMPKLYLIDSSALNAYTSGLSEKSYAVTVTTGLLEQLNKEEVETVLGHELTHILNKDVRLLIIGVIFAGMISFFAEMIWRSMLYSSGRRSNKNGGAMLLIAGVVLAVGYLFSLVIRMAISRKREFLADAGAVELTRNPDAMVSALHKISGKSKLEKAPAEVRQMFIENPPAFSGLFSTHPPIEKRIAALVAYAGARDVILPGREAPALTETASPAKPSGPWGRLKGPWSRS